MHCSGAGVESLTAGGCKCHKHSQEFKKFRQIHIQKAVQGLSNKTSLSLRLEKHCSVLCFFLFLRLCSMHPLLATIRDIVLSKADLQPHLDQACLFYHLVLHHIRSGKIHTCSKFSSAPWICTSYADKPTICISVLCMLALKRCQPSLKGLNPYTANSVYTSLVGEGYS